MRIYTSDGNAYVWQWQPKEHIVLDGYPDGVFVHYANCDTAKSPVVQTRRESGKLIADIPPELMMTDKDITVYVCDVDGTMHCHFLPVIGRPKPASYIYEPVEVLRYETLAERVRALEERPNNGTGGSVDLDDTLTKSGMAADAKATGDEIKRVEGLIPSIDGLAKTEDIPTKPEDVGALPNTYTPPNQTADQVGADPRGTATSAVGAHNTSDVAHNDIRLEIKAIRDQLSAFLDVDEETLNELSELIAAIVANQSSIAQLTSGKVNVSDIVNNLITNAPNKPLSAAQGVALKALIDGLSSGKLDANKLDSAIDTSLARAKASGVFDGEDGKDGVGISGASINAKGQLVITYSDGKTVNLDKVVGMNGTNGVGISKSEINASGELVITYTNGQQVNLGGVIGAAGKDGTDGADGKTPVKGVDYFTPADKAELVGMVLEVLQGKVISGYVAEDGSIVINGLPDGNYTVKYEMADGSTLQIGELVLDTRVYYSVTGNLSNCVSSNSAVSVAQGDSYKTTITAVSGYALESVTVTMGGVDITAQAVSGGSISIAGVTGDVVITAVAVSAGPGYTNLAQPDPNATGEAAWNAGGWCNGSYIAGSSYAYRGSTDMTRVTTNTFAVESGDTIYVKGIKYATSVNAQIALLNADGGRIYNSSVAQTDDNSYISNLSATDGADSWSFCNAGPTGADHGTRFIRLAGYLSGGVNDVIITRNQPIE